MRKIVRWFVLLFLVFSSRVLANGVCVVDATEGKYIWLINSDIEVLVENQVAIVTVRQVFFNQFSEEVRLKYAFPIPEGASPTGLRWNVNDVWYRANFAVAPTDTTLPGSGHTIDSNLLDYLGQTPLFFDIEQTVAAGARLMVELTYVQLLPYAFGNVEFTFPNDYALIQNHPLDAQSFDFQLKSQRTILILELLNHAPTSLFNDGTSAAVQTSVAETPAVADYHVRYTLNPEELGLFGLSTFQPDSVAVDDIGRGFFLFVAEPDPSQNTEALAKVFTLIVDRSGSMAGQKIIQARNAARYVVNHLNLGDLFNIVDFSDRVASFRPTHVRFTTDTREAALAYIDGLQAQGSTNISGAFSEAVPQFAAANDSTANIIVFFTDGRPTFGITDMDGILDHVQALINQNETRLTVFTFGVGPDVNTQLLTRLATENGGLVEFLGNDELEARITAFYQKIRNPVLLNTQITFSVPIVRQLYPGLLPSLYKGQQMIVAGRYDEAAPLEVTLSGTAFGQPVSFSYDLALADSNATAYQFLPKIWAKLKIEDLYLHYLGLDAFSPEAMAIREEIVQVSLGYGVISAFTSFQGGTEDPDDDDEAATAVEADDLPPLAFELLGNYPNPFRERTRICFRLDEVKPQTVTIKVFDALGRLVRVLLVQVTGPGPYEVVWDGRTDAGMLAPSGTYFYLITLDEAVFGGKMTLVR